jgi:hypothetical protein
MEQSSTSKVGSPLASQEISAFYGTWMFITVFKRATTYTYPEPDRSNPHRTFQLS